MSQTPYAILGVSPSATQEEIKNAYRTLAKKFHPDLNPGNKDAEKKFKELNAANELIGSPEARAKYDRGESEAQQQAHATRGGRAGGGRAGPFYHETQSDGGRYSNAFEGMDEEMLQSIFGRMGGARSGGRRASPDQPGEDALYRMEIDFKDAVLGGEQEITLPTGKTLRVKIPAGVETGAKLRFTGQGGPGRGKAPAGDAYVELNVRPSKLFKRDKMDVEIELPLSLSEAVLGAEIKVPTIDGSVLLKIPAQVSSGQRLRIPGKGVVATGSTKRGDQFVVLKVVTPKEVDDEFKQAVEAWSKRQPSDVRAAWVGSEGGVA